MKARLIATVAGILAIAFVAFYSGGMDRKPKELWSEGYWIWAGEQPAPGQFTGDSLYVEVTGTQWPKDLPKASKHVVVRRIDPRTKLTKAAAHILVEDYKALVADSASGASVAGLQIDYDCPTGKLRSYAQFLSWIRHELPANHRLSIALG
jgi:hypothetical protein